VKTEHEEQKQVCNYLDKLNKLYFSIPNGFVAGGRNKFAGIKKLKAEGFKNGVPDLFICEPNKEYSGLFIEMKKEKGGVVSDDQKQWITQLIFRGYSAVVANGFLEAKEIIDEYFKE